MGSEVHDAIKNFETQDEKGKLASDSLDAMMELAEHQKEVFYLKVTSSNVDTKIVPVGQILFRDHLVRCDDVSSGTGNVGNTIKKKLQAICVGSYQTILQKCSKANLNSS